MHEVLKTYFICLTLVILHMLNIYHAKNYGNFIQLNGLGEIFLGSRTFERGPDYLLQFINLT